MARWRTVVPLAALALLLAVLLLAVPSVRTALPGVTQRAEYTNPVIRWDFADPSVLKADDGWYYAYSTENLTIERLAYIQAARSRDLVNWELLPDAMPEKPEWADTTRDFWAPGVIEADGRYYMYFSGIHDERESMCLGVATSDSPGGPFVPEDEPPAVRRRLREHRPHAFRRPADGEVSPVLGFRRRADPGPAPRPRPAEARDGFQRQSPHLPRHHPAVREAGGGGLRGLPRWLLLSLLLRRQLLFAGAELRRDGGPFAQRHGAFREALRDDG